ncbi:ArnT family glycosyltransferase [Angustibacter sp. McL0619]|uniref:ArnT family glycosyltransferase n=1 Tax=Angustibacter sp. McL0619 TaxID=3415676 RepID=UPI003CF1D02F
MSEPPAALSAALPAAERAAPPPLAWRQLSVVVLVLLAVLLPLATRYGFHRDELYFLAGGRHLAWGFPDQGPLTPALARLADLAAPGSLLALRIPAALLTSVTVLTAALTARELGGRVFGQVLAAVTVAIGTLTLIGGHLLVTSTVDLTVWASTGWLTTRLLRTRDPRLWLALGLVCGIGLNNKQLPVVLAGATVLAIGLDRTARRLLLSRWLVAGAVVAVALWAPGLTWQAQHGWPQLELAGQIRAEYGVLGERIGFLATQLVIFSVGATVLLVAGVRAMVRDPRWRPFRPLAVTALVVLVFFIVVAGQVYYPAGSYLPLFAAGAVVVEERRTRWRTVVTVAWTSALLIPAALPVLPLSTLAASPWTGLGEQQRETAGWPEFVDQVAAVYRTIPAGERTTTVVFTSNYGEAGAVDELGASRGLPRAYSGHNGYGDWGPPPPSATGPVVVVAEGGPPNDDFDGCDTGHKVTGPVPNEERDYASIYLCQGPRGGWTARWPYLVHLDS